jgi:hypothetical protein
MDDGQWLLDVGFWMMDMIFRILETNGW